MKKLLSVFLASVCGVALAQQPAQAPAGNAGGGPNAASLQPALSAVDRAVSGLQPERWKLSNALKQQTSADVGSIQRDINATVPGLISAADAAPNSASAALPLADNIDALYNVVLRVAEKAQLTAPDAQTAGLAQALQQLEDARKSLNRRITASAAATERQVSDLRANLKTQTDAVAAANAQIATLQAAAKAAPAKTTRKTTKKAATPAAKPAATTAAPAKPSGL